MRTSGIKHLLLVFCIIFSFDCIFCQNSNSVSIANDRDKTFVTVRVGSITITKILLDTGFPYNFENKKGSIFDAGKKTIRL